MDLQTYNEKRNFRKTREPKGKVERSAGGNRYLIQKHAASRLHYDFRLELDGVLKSWAVPKGPSLNPEDKRLAVMTEDHPLAYGDFEGTIPQGEYGGGTVMLWDTGSWEPEGDAAKDIKKGRLTFTLHGERLQGRWHLTRMPRRKGEKQENWLLIKGKDEFADEHGEKLVEEFITSVVTDRGMEKIAKGAVVKKSKTFSIALPRKAKKLRMPDFIAPQLATLEDETPEGDNWIHEIKYDGYRLQLHKNGDTVYCYTRRGNDWTVRFPRLCEAARQLPVKQIIIDGELVVLNEQGISEFQLLQNALTNEKENPMHFYAFDLLYVDGYDMRKAALLERKAMLKEVIILASGQSYIEFSEHITGQGETVYNSSCSMALEGIISKKADGAYVSGRTRDWLKSKCSKRQEFVIAGFQEPTHRQRGIRSLLLGYYEDGKLRYAGKVGTGFSDKSGMELRTKLDTLIRKTTPFTGELPAEARRNGIWVEPKLVGEVEFIEWTESGSLRHASFLGLREDKPAIEVVREMPDSMDKPKSKPMPDIRLTSPDKILWPSQGLTKEDLVEYYHSVAERMLPYVVNRPLSLVRCPEGNEEACFFQRHQGKGFPKDIHSIRIAEADGEAEDYLTIADEAGLLSLVQVGALEIHPWGARNDDPDRPDMMIFDMDPAEDVPWKQVKEAAIEAKERLEIIGLQSFLKVTGGKGLHVVVPLQRKQDWEVVKPFTRAFAQSMESDSPQRYISKSTKAKRKGKIFIDYLRNDKTSTAIAPYSTRAKDGAPVALPITWEELDSLTSANMYRVNNVQRRLAHLKADPWADYFTVKQSLTQKAVKAYG